MVKKCFESHWERINFIAALRSDSEQLIPQRRAKVRNSSLVNAPVFFYKCAPVPLAIYIVSIRLITRGWCSRSSTAKPNGRFVVNGRISSWQLRTVGQICYLLEFLAHLGTVVSCIQDARFDIIVTSDLSSRWVYAGDPEFRYARLMAVTIRKLKEQFLHHQ